MASNNLLSDLHFYIFKPVGEEHVEWKILENLAWKNLYPKQK